MKRWLWLPALLIVIGSIWLGAARAQGPGRVDLRAFGGQPVSANRRYSYVARGTLTPAGQQVTDCAFGPGRGEIAFLGPQGEASALWLTRIGGLDEARERAQRRIQELRRTRRPWSKEVSDEFWGLMNQRFDTSSLPPRLLWVAPAGVPLLGPILWAPNGSALLVRARQGEATDLVLVDYATGRSLWLTKGAHVVEAVWPATGAGLAYVTEEGGKRRLWVEASLTGKAKPIGEGGWDLRWSADGTRLVWLAPLSETNWAEMERDGDEVSQIGTKPARPAGTTWSPDDRWCAALVGDTDKQLMLWAAGSARGEHVPLPGVGPQRLLSWSPDSHLLLVLAAGDMVGVLSVEPPAPKAIVMTTAGEQRAAEEVYCGEPHIALLDWVPMQADAGVPTWSADGKWVVYVASAQLGAVEQWQRAPEGKSPAGRLFALQGELEHVDIYHKLTPELERTLELQRMKNVAMALQMYLSDYDRVPTTNDQRQVMGVLDEYVRNRDTFMNPTDNSQPVVRWLFDPGTPTSALDDPAQTAVAVIDYNPAFHVIAYADGHAVLVEGPLTESLVTMRFKKQE